MIQRRMIQRATQEINQMEKDDTSDTNKTGDTK